MDKKMMALLATTGPLTREQFAAVGEIVVEDIETGMRRGKRTRLKLHDKKGALVDLGKHLGLFKQQVEHTGENGGPIRIAGAGVSGLLAEAAAHKAAA